MYWQKYSRVSFLWGICPTISDPIEAEKLKFLTCQGVRISNVTRLSRSFISSLKYQGRPSRSLKPDPSSCPFELTVLGIADILNGFPPVIDRVRRFSEFLRPLIRRYMPISHWKRTSRILRAIAPGSNNCRETSYWSPSRPIRRKISWATTRTRFPLFISFNRSHSRKIFIAFLLKKSWKYYPIALVLELVKTDC